MKPGETTLDKVQRKLKLLNDRLSIEAEYEDTNYHVTLTKDGSGAIRDGQGDLVTFDTTKELLSFLDAPFANQVRLIHYGEVKNFPLS